MIYLDQKILLPDTVKAIYAVGDIHGEFMACVNDLTESCKLRDAAVIVCGDIGMGFNSYDWYISTFRRMEERLSERGIYLICFRGNHDNPAYFRYNTDSRITTEFPHVILAEDFTLVDAPERGDQPYRVLLWGGARSIDKANRIAGYSYWSGEMPEALPDRFKEEGFDINCVCSHTAPAFCFPITKGGIVGWSRYDKDVVRDCEREREILSEGCGYLMKNNRFTLELWCYGHFHETIWNYSTANKELSEYASCKFVGLDMLRSSSYDRKDQVNQKLGLFDRKHANNIIKIHTLLK